MSLWMVVAGGSVIKIIIFKVEQHLLKSSIQFVSYWFLEYQYLLFKSNKLKNYFGNNMKIVNMK